MVKWLIVFMMVITSTISQGQWYEAKGSAHINGKDSAIAKSLAMENALKKALLVAGASVSSVQQVVNGLLTQDELNIRAKGVINAFELVEESYTDNIVNVTIRADIFSQDQKCFSADFKKSILLTRSNLLHREQANIGGIYDIDNLAMEKLAATVQKEGRYLDTVSLLKNKTKFSRLNKSLNAEEIKDLVMSLSQIKNTQFVMFSEIHDVSFANEANNNWQFWQEDQFDRQFDIEIYVYDGNNGELILNKHYKTKAPWSYTKRAQVDINSLAFWQSSYGSSIEQTLNDMSTDMDEAMMCQTTKAKIVQVSTNQVKINIGKRNGVQVGDEFSLLHLNNFIANDGKTYAGFNVSDQNIKVTQVSEYSASAISKSGEVLNNIQLNDLAVKQ